MDLNEARDRLEAAARQLEEDPEPPTVDVATWIVNGRPFRLAITRGFVTLSRSSKRDRLWKHREMLTAIKNGAYGFDPTAAQSRGGRDGVFLVTTDFMPKNEMVARLYDRYIDRPGSGFAELNAHLRKQGFTFLSGARLVSHHVRLLGVLFRSGEGDLLVLVDLHRGSL